MPAIDYRSIQETEWIKNATYFWGIPLNPRGEIILEELYNKTFNDLEQERIQLSNILNYCILSTIISYLFMRNFIVSAKAVIMYRRLLAPWCCLIAALPSMAFPLQNVLFLFEIRVSCRTTVWYGWFSISTAQFFYSIILLQKAYLIVSRRKWILYTGIPLILPRLSFGFVIMFSSFATMDDTGACNIYYDLFIPYYWFGATVTINMILFFIFCNAAYKQYRKFGSRAWKKLARDGIQAMTMVIVCNITCCLLVIFQVNDDRCDMFFWLDWAITATLLVNHCRNIKEAKKVSNRPITRYILNLSQIKTAK
ncbi:hypothetical protein BDF19DRAFT_434619 [Syncephalis fuscata]|nr:hypothetical protein BDF19DRAFT_434619 [Syncephalis fuscata]